MEETEKEAEANRRGIGLAVSIDLPTVLRLQQLIGTQLAKVLGAEDAETALGLAISTQPDISIIDTRLDPANGSDLAVILPFYAPRTKRLLLSDDHDLAAKAQLVGIEVMPREFSEEALLSWVAVAAA